MFAKLLDAQAFPARTATLLPLRKLAPVILAAAGLGSAVWFFSHESGKLGRIGEMLHDVSAPWMWAGLLVTFIYILLQGAMYRFSMRASEVPMTLGEGTMLFLKRNFVSPFIPAGGLVSLGMFTRSFEKKGMPRGALYFGSAVYALLGMASLAVVAVPVLFYLLLRESLGAGELAGLGWIVLLAVLLGWFLRAVRQRGSISRWLLRLSPAVDRILQDFSGRPYSPLEIARAFTVSLWIEAAGVLHLWIAMRALGVNGSWEAALASYVVAMLAMVISPFLRGLGGVELVMTLTLTRFGLSPAEALSVTLLFRLFEFWLVLAAGVAAFLRGAESLLFRFMPPLFLMALGAVNVISAVTPALPERVGLLRDFLPLYLIHCSNFLVLTSGLVLLLTSVYLLRGLRLAWWVATVLAALSVVGHVTKGFDFEEAALGLVTLLALWRTKSQYFIRIDRRKGWFGALVFGATLCFAILYGTLGFYFLDKRMFGFDFSWEQSLGSTMRLFFLLDASYLHPLTNFARHFLVSIAFAGMISILLGLYYLLLPHIVQFGNQDSDTEEAQQLVRKYGQSGLDYYKTYQDKQLFFNAQRNGFLAYRIAKNYAVVLEKPVGPDEKTQKNTLRAFERFCRESGLKPVFYRVSEKDLSVFGKRKSLRIGQEAVTDLPGFSLEGSSMKSLRNAVSRAEKEGMVFRVYEAPVKLGVLQKCKAVSDAWLAAGRREIAFSSGVFSYTELQRQTLLTVEDREECVIAFVNLIPDYAPGEATYDLLRRLPDAPGWAVDFLMVKMLLHLRAKGYQKLNLGMAPMSGCEDGNLPERTLQLVYSKAKSLSHYRGVRSFKEKFADEWENRYLVYDADADLIAMPRVLAAVVKA